MKLIVGLGNPGKEYENTRHNIGYKVLDYLAQKNNLVFSSKKFNAEYCDLDINGEKTILIKPLLYMNLSGQVVKKYVDFYKIDINNIIVIQDDLDMPVGKIKFCFNRNSGGHNGIKNIIENIGTKEFLRLKIGILNDNKGDTIDYVLGNFTKEENLKLKESFIILSDLLEDFDKFSPAELMSKYNGIVK